MSVFSEIAEQAKKQFKSNLRLKSLTDSVKSRTRQEEDFSEDTEWLSAQEFKRRYRNVRIAAISAGVLGIVSFLMIAFSHSFKDFALALLSATVLELFYVKLSFLLWASRRLLETKKTEFLRVGDFFAAICADPQQFLPLPIAPKVSKE
jgi:hypothetical protein